MLSSSTLHVISNLLIPLDDSGNFAPDRLSALLCAQKSDGPDALLVGATTHDQAERDFEQRCALFRLVADHPDARSTLIADVNAATPELAARLACASYERGFHATSLCLSVASSQGIASGRAVIRAVAAAAPTPIYVRIFDRPNVETTLDRLVTLIGAERIAGVLVYCRDSMLLRRLRGHPAGSMIYCGLEESLIAHLTVGATGLVSHLASFLTPLFREVQAAIGRDDLARAVALQELASGFVNVASGMGVIAAAKGWMALLGVDCGPCRGANGCLTLGEWRLLARWLEDYLLHEMAAPLCVSA